jgi:hypothetical protein
MTCEICGHEMQIGDWAWCPHGTGNNLQRPMEAHLDEMIATAPVEFTTISEKVRYMDRNAIVPRNEVRRASRPSTDLPAGSIREAIHDTFRDIRNGRYDRR